TLEPLDLVERAAEEPGGLDRVPHERVPLEGDPPLDEPLGGPAQTSGVRPALDGLEAAPVERQRRRVEHVEPQVGEVLEVLQRGTAEGLDVLGTDLLIAVRERDEV